MIPFEFVTARSFEAAAQLLAESRRGDVLLKAGGIDVVDRLKEGLDRPKVILNIRGLRPARADAVRKGDNGLTIHALATLTEINENEAVRADYPAVAAGTRKPATPQVRNVASLAGNLCQKPRCWYYRSLDFRCLKKGGDRCYAVNGDNRYHAVLGAGACHIVAPSSAAPSLMACGAMLRIGRYVDGKLAERTLPIADFYRVPSNPQDDEFQLGHDELILDVTLPQSAAGRHSAYVELKEKQSFDWAMASCAVNLNDRAAPRIVLGAVAPIPWRLPKVEQLVAGQKLTDTLIAEARRAAIVDARPMTNNGYKVTLAGAVLEHALRAADEGA